MVLNGFDSGGNADEPYLIARLRDRWNEALNLIRLIQMDEIEPGLDF